jgi:hypothetical protein
MTTKPFRITVLTAAIVLGVAMPALAAPLGPVRASDLVRLIAFADSPSTCPSFGIPFEQIAPNGVRTPFVIPPGKVLVITSVHFEVFNGNPSTNVNAVVSEQMAGQAFRLTLATGTALLDAGGEGGGAILILTGVRVPAGRTVCMQPAGGGLTGGILYGYLAPDQ